nr:trypsin-like peptidase domain-containing protein [bacterium]
MSEPIFYYDDDANKKNTHRTGWVIALISIAAVSCLLGAAFLGPLFADKAQTTPTPPVIQNTPITTDTPSTPGSSNVNLGGSALTLSNENILEQIYEKISPAIVSVSNMQYKFGQGGRTLQLAGTGSGVVVSEEGYIITNYHVIQDANQVLVTFSDGVEVEAEIIGGDAPGDLAVLKVDKDNLTVVPIGDADNAKVGSLAIAIGNPDRFAGTLTVGYISGPQRTITLDSGYSMKFLQTDAAINPGNSGGALLNSKGELIGITALKTTYVGTDEYGNAIAAEGLGFAIPINEAMPIVQEIIQKGYYSRPTLGISGRDVTTAMQMQGYPKGFLVKTVTKGGAAEKAGIKAEDVITGIDGVTVESYDSLIEELYKHKPGDTVTLTIRRPDPSQVLELNLEVVLGDS